MEYAKDEVFSINYNAEKDKLGNGIARRMLNKIRRNRFLTFLFTMGAVFSILNCVLIYYFFFLFRTI